MQVLQEGDLFLFRLYAPYNYIVGGGFFTRTLLLPVSLAWEAFGVANGAEDLPAVQQRVAKYRAKQSPMCPVAKRRLVPQRRGISGRGRDGESAAAIRQTREMRPRSIWASGLYELDSTRSRWYS